MNIANYAKCAAKHTVCFTELLSETNTLLGSIAAVASIITGQDAHEPIRVACVSALTWAACFALREKYFPDVQTFAFNLRSIA